MNPVVESKGVMARLGRFERPTSGSGDQRQNAMLMIRLARSCMLQHDIAGYSAGYGRKSDLSSVLLLPSKSGGGCTRRHRIQPGLGHFGSRLPQGIAMGD